MNGDNAIPTVSCRDVVKIYGSGNAEVHALRGVDLDVYPGELTMLVGPSGCGKTTLLSVVAGILRPTRGAVNALGTDLTRLSSWRRTAFRRDSVGFVFQQFNLLPALTAAENAAVPLVIFVVLFIAVLISYPWYVLSIGSVMYLAALPLSWLSFRKQEQAFRAQRAAPDAAAANMPEPPFAPPPESDSTDRPTRLN